MRNHDDLISVAGLGSFAGTLETLIPCTETVQTFIDDTTSGSTVLLEYLHNNHVVLFGPDSGCPSVRRSSRGCVGSCIGSNSIATLRHGLLGVEIARDLPRENLRNLFLDLHVIVASTRPAVSCIVLGHQGTEIAWQAAVKLHGKRCSRQLRREVCCQCPVRRNLKLCHTISNLSDTIAGGKFEAYNFLEQVALVFLDVEARRKEFFLEPVPVPVMDRVWICQRGRMPHSIACHPAVEISSFVYSLEDRRHAR